MTDLTSSVPTLLDTIEPKVIDALNEQADDLAHGKKPNEYVKAAMVLGSAPLMLGALATMAPAQTTSNAVVDVLNFALLLENLESEFYKAVLGTSSVAAFNTAFATVRGKFAAANPTISPTIALISAHEIAHVNFLTTTINSLAAGAAKTYDPAATFDFTGARGVAGAAQPFATATTDVGFLLASAQGFEDTGVRAYKGQAGKLLGQQVPLTAALQIHALEARHAARIRRLRRTLDATATAARYSGTVKGGGLNAAAIGATAVPAAAAATVQAAFTAIYAGEDNTSHVVNNGTTNVTVNAASLAGLASGADVTLAFDEALGATAVAAIVQNFIIPTLPALSTNLQLTNP